VSRRTRSFVALIALAFLVAPACASWRQPERGGTGLVLAKRETLTRVVELVPGSPAASSGIVPGDVLLSVDGKPTEHLSLADIVQLLIGASGTVASLEIASSPNGPPRLVSIVRAPLYLATVEASRLDPQMLYVRIRSFAPGTAASVARALEGQPASQTLVLDLRGNNGGELEAIVRTADLLLPAGAPIGSLDPGDGSAGKQYVSEDGAIASFRDILVLVNYETAGGAELVCLALRGAKLATLVGTRTHGYGTVESRISPSHSPISVDGVLKGPGGLEFDRVGIEPDVHPPVDAAWIHPPESDPLVAWVRTEGRPQR
jgi:carboxyl-terminal processing protease